ncbi:MAG TPA: nitrilase-related carbon-nitrogen hydrolase, partial [Rhodocyclaceae bacterium]|nr:nitrilase-related carbon-nitrogen hydrolase [Rhodocyclaceae bacterium]
MENSLVVAVAQLNCVVGDLSGNARRILEAVSRAQAAGADVVLTPELALCGYPPEDLLLRPAFLDACAAELDALAAQVQGVTVLVGHPLAADGLRYNAASVIRDGRVVATYRKHRLPNYEVFDEERYFEAGTEACVFEHKGVRIGVNICADVWEAGAADVARGAGAELLLVLNASPYHMNKQQRRYEVMRERIADTGLPVVYCNLVGGQDELVFDGGSFALDRQG